MDDGAKLLLGLGALALLGYGGYQYSQSQKKKNLIEQIMIAGRNIPNFDASISVLQQATIPELEAILIQIQQESSLPPAT